MPKYTREPLVEIDRNSNAWPASAHRKALPTKKWGSKDLDTTGGTNQTAYEVKPKTDYYLDCDDNRGK